MISLNYMSPAAVLKYFALATLAITLCVCKPACGCPSAAAPLGDAAESSASSLPPQAVRVNGLAAKPVVDALAVDEFADLIVPGDTATGAVEHRVEEKPVDESADTDEDVGTAEFAAYDRGSEFTVTASSAIRRMGGRITLGVSGRGPPV